MGWRHQWGSLVSVKPLLILVFTWVLSPRPCVTHTWYQGGRESEHLCSKLSGYANVKAFGHFPIACSNSCTAGDCGTASSGVVLQPKHLGFRKTNSWLQMMENLSYIACFACDRENFFVKGKKVKLRGSVLFWLLGSFSRTFFKKCPHVVFATSWYIGDTLGSSSPNNCNSRIYFSFF